MAKKTYIKKNGSTDPNVKKTEQEEDKGSKTLSKLANSKIEESLKDFGKLSEKERKDILDSEDFFEQFREFFKQRHPMLLDEIDSQEKLTIYVKSLEKMGFSLKNIMNNTKELHNEFKETVDEKSTIENSLKQLQQFCEKPENKMPTDIFDKFANEIGLKTTPNIEITEDTKITKIGELSKLRRKFIENNDIKLKDYQKTEIQNFVSPNYLPTERLLISATIKKIKKNLPEELHGDFDTEFPTPINIHSRFQSLKDLKQRRVVFLEEHRSIIDESLAKKLDKIIITNGDIFKEFQFEGENINRTGGFSDQTKNFRMMFNQLATRQLFEESKETGTYIEHHLEQIGNEFKAFPPYFNEILNIYPYNHEKVINQQETYKSKYTNESNILSEKEKELEKTDISEEQKEIIRKEIFEIKEKLKEIKRKAYADYIKTQDKEIGNIMIALIDNKFDISKLSKEDQQKILNTLVDLKLGDSIKNKIPNILGIDNDEYQSFIKNLFDLDKKEITIPTTQYGEIPIEFIEKSFLGGPTKELFDVGSGNKALSEQKNLPLNLRIKINEQNKDFFEDNIIFEEYFNTFHSKNGPIKINDSYKVRIKNKEGKIVEGYLSRTAPINKEQDDESISQQKDGWFLYSKPITRPEEDREIVTRDGSPDGDPVVILADQENENNYEIDILSKEINLNGEGISGLLFSHVLGKYNENNSLSRDQERKINQQFGKLPGTNIYKDTIDNYMHIIKEDEEKETDKEKEESNNEKDKREFLEEWKNLEGYQEKDYEKNDKEKTYGFKKGAKLLIRGPESSFFPTGFYQYITAEVKEIKENKVKFKLTGNEVSLGKYEGCETEIPLSKVGINKIKEVFENKVYKLPNESTCKNITELIPAMETATIDGINPIESFKGTNRDGNNFNISIGKEQNKPVSYFGIVETKPGEDGGKESKTAYMYKVEHEPGKNKFKLTANDEKKTVIHLDYPNFILFISSRKLQPQTEESAKAINIEKSDGPSLKEPKKWKGYSFASILGLFKNFGKKIGDGLKKYEEEQVEDLTDNIFYHGKLFHTLSKIMPTEKLRTAFGNAGDEYMTERDNKTWKKIEKYQKFFESDPDFGGKYMREKNIKPYLNGTKKFKDHYQAAGMLLATIKKGKGPYSRNTDWAGKGMWVRVLFGEAHQARYLLMKQKLERELQQGYKIHGQIWADDLQNEILKLEMKYITHCIDGRQLRVGEDDVARLEGMYSKKFATELENVSNEFFSSMVSKSYEAAKTYSFELARFEYFRLLGDRPQQAIPCLKQMACKAVTPTQWRVFESAVLTGMLSGVFYNITQEDKSFIQKICRTIGFLPGMRIRDPNHHYKVEKFIKIVTNEDITGYNNEKEKKTINYDSSKFGFGKGKDLDQYKKVVGYDNGLNLRFTSNGRLEKIGKFAAMEGKNYQGKTLIELLNDPKTPGEIKEILAEIEARSLEKDEDVDGDVKMNGYGLEQNILAKNQSLIGEITDFQNGEFKAKDKDEKQGIQTARNKIANSIPRQKLADENQVIYILKKFMNRFEQRGFNVEEKRFLIRALKTIKEEEKKGNTEGLEEILWYLIVGNVVESSGNHQPPKELINGLEAFKDFFKNNKDTILKPNIIEQGMGNIFVNELNKKPFKVAPWNEYIDIAKNKFIIGESKEERKIRSEKQKLYRVPNLYINEKIYKLALDIERKNHIPNMFDKYFSLEKKKSTSQRLKEVLDPKTTIQTKNPEIINKAMKKISGDNEVNYDGDEETLAEIAEAEEDEYDNFY